MKKVFVAGPLPPPVHGMSKNLLLTGQRIEKNFSVIYLNTSPESLDRNFFYHSKKIIKFMKALAKYLMHGRAGEVLYIAPDAGLGQLYSIIFLSWARLLGQKIFIHHHSFRYVRKKSKLMGIQAYVSRGATHIFLCDQMRDRFCELYPTKDSIVVNNSIYTGDPQLVQLRQEPKNFVQLCALGNLDEQKGIFEILDTYKQCRDQGIPVRLRLGGPIGSTKAKEEIDYLISNDTCVESLGFISNKAEFFRDADVMLMPTKYANEAQPNVIFEAYSFGVDVISVDRGCIKSDILNKEHIVPIENFSQRAADIIKKFSDRKLEHESKNREEIINYYEFLQDRARDGMETLIARIRAAVDFK
ncbi:glycosyltransferase family 4 protein [Pseudacidovorax intermedius]|uniref:glycosyltransferase family 4 protein n=1 Tax=Pseudacidovorax intermedius TaxID=433924 RepID=UPI0026EAA7DF|nr:glycosyltransferase family 4 protein [Pseudacidovorax intermedius]